METGESTPSRESAGEPTGEASRPKGAASRSGAAAQDGSPLAFLMRRGPWDVALGAAALSLFAAADSWNQLTGTMLSSAVALVDGLVVGLAVSALAHEWGHYAGARLADSIAPLRRESRFFPLFDFDYVGNSSSQFLSMSVGGNVAHWLVVVVLAAGLPVDSVGQLALVSASVGFAAFASSLEVPVMLRCRNGASPLDALRGIPRDFARRYGTVGLVAGLVAFAIL